MTSHKRSRMIITIFVAILLTAGTIVAISFAKGYRPNLKGGTIQGTGLLSATSYPKSAQVFIDDKFTSATDTTINLLPGEYTVKILKEGFLPWEKRLNVRAELVSTTDARLFPAVPSLSALTLTSSIKPQPSPDGRRIAYFVTDASASDNNGLFVIDTNSSPLSLSRSPQQILPLNPNHKVENSHILWSPNSKEILVIYTNPEQNAVLASQLLDADNLNGPSTPDVTVRLPLIFSQWEEELFRGQTADLDLLPDLIADLATSSAITNLYFSPNKEKIIYTSTTTQALPNELKSAVLSLNPTSQNRNLEPNKTYVYDTKEDTNYLIGDAPKLPSKTLIRDPKSTITPTPGTVATGTSQAIQAVYNQFQQGKSHMETVGLFKSYYLPLYTGLPSWYQTSRHLISTKDNKIDIFEYDNTNHSVVYSGPFSSEFLMVSPSGDRLLILTNLNQDTAPANLYSLDLK